MLAYTFDASTQEEEAGLSSRQAWSIEQVPVQSKLLRKNCHEKQTQNRRKERNEGRMKKRRKESKMQE